MPDSDRHRNKLVVGIRGADDKLRDDARDAAKSAGYADLSAATIAFWEWLCWRPGANGVNRPADTALVARQILDRLESLVAKLTEAGREDEARQIMGSVSTFETDWWGNHG